MKHPRIAPRSALALVLSTGLALVACGDDGETTSSTSSGPGATTGTSAGGGGTGGAGTTTTTTGPGGGNQGGGGGGVGPYVPPTYETVDCAGTVPVASSGTCEVSSDGTSGILLRGTVLGPDTLYKDGGVLIDEDGIIQCVGCDCATAPGGDDASVVDCGEGVISPGLINPHDHITYANNAPYDNGNTRYEHRHEWRIENVSPTLPAIPYDGQATTAQILSAELRFLMGGATSGATAGGAAGLMRNVDQGNRLEGLPVKAADSDTFPLDDANGRMRTNDCDYGNNATDEGDIAGRDGYLPHVAEGIGAAARNEFVCTSTDAITDSHDLLERQTAIVHAVGMKPADFATMRDELAAVIWSPRSNIVLYGNTAPVTLIDAMSVPIALGTDWLLSGSSNLLRELACADSLNSEYFGGHFSDHELWRMVTENAAMATGIDKVVGALRPGYVADIAVFDASVRTDFRAVIGANSDDVALVLRGGEALYGDAALLSEAAFGKASCEDISVCSRAKKACVAQDTSSTLAAVVAAGTPFFQMFTCEGDALDGEPSCTPYRSSYPDGITAGDSDGDGIANASDLCPTVFDPIRPIDGGEQGDADGDGIGDACDPCPLDTGIVCELTSVAADVDGDGIFNAADGCPEDADPGQEDGDGDGINDACDPCPESPNPGGTACAFPIATVRNPAASGHPAEGATVAVVGHVTAIGAEGFAMQDGIDPWSGIYVFTFDAPSGIAVGNEVSVTGEYDEFFNLSEIVNPTVVVLDAGTTLPFSAVSIANPSTLATAATAEPYESMLVQIGTVTITTQNADAPSDFDEFVVTGGLRINDGFFTALDNTCAVGSQFTSIRGIHNFSFGNYKLEPRNAADIVHTTCQPYP